MKNTCLVVLSASLVFIEVDTYKDDGAATREGTMIIAARGYGLEFYSTVHYKGGKGGEGSLRRRLESPRGQSWQSLRKADRATEREGRI